ncbi:hypothetical protein [Shewanella algae]|uniref:hypothetical protein n=1 Tax=Shewanella algae TaxID=38313 RepID=UPI00300619A7
MKTANEYKSIFEGILTGFSQWKRLAGSQFVAMQSTFVGQMVSKSIFSGYRYLQECFLSTAVKRSSVLASAEDRGYVGRKRMPSIGTALVQNFSGKLVSIPRDAPIISKASIQYVVTKAVEIPAGESVDVPISQLVLRVFSSTVTKEQKFCEILLPRAVTAITHRVDVYVSTSSGAAELWEKRFMFRRADARTKAYAEFYKPTEQLGIRFGNGINGMIPPVGSTITLKVWTTDGDTTLIDRQPLEFIGDSSHLNNNLAISTKTPIVGGAAAESAEETRAGALNITSFDNQLAWDDDYAHYIKSNMANLVWVNAWGEQEQERQDGGVRSLEHINTVFVSAFSSKLDQSQLSSIISDLMRDTNYLNKRYKYVLANELPFTIVLDGAVTGDKDFLMVKKTVKDAVRAVYGRIPTKDRPVKILKKDVSKLIEELGIFYDFEIDWSEYPGEPKLEDYIYLDIDNSVINLSYKDL